MMNPLGWRRRLGFVAVPVVTLALLSGCGSSSKSNTTPPKTTSASAGATNGSKGCSSGSGKTYTVGIDIPFHPIFDYLEAKSSQYFKCDGFTVKFKVLSATTQSPSFAKGQLDVMTTTPSFIPRLQEQYGIAASYIFPLARWSIGPQLLVKKGSPYHTLQSLHGKPVAIPPLSSRFGAEEAATLAATGQTITKYFNLQQTNADAQDLALGRVDGAWIEAPSTYPLLQSGKYVAVYSVHDAFLKAFHDPAVLNGGFIAKTSFIKQNPAFVKALVSACNAVWNKYVADPTAVDAVASKVSGVSPAELATVGKALDLNMPRGQRAVLPRDVATWTKLFPLLAKSGFISKAPSNTPSLFIVTKP